jgi:hypothetical protein
MGFHILPKAVAEKHRMLRIKSAAYNNTNRPKKKVSSLNTTEEADEKDKTITEVHIGQINEKRMIAKRAQR